MNDFRVAIASLRATHDDKRDLIEIPVNEGFGGSEASNYVIVGQALLKVFSEVALRRGLGLPSNNRSSCRFCHELLLESVLIPVETWGESLLRSFVEDCRIALDPVMLDTSLSVFERHFARAYFAVQFVFELVFGVIAGRAVAILGELWP